MTPTRKPISCSAAEILGTAHRRFALSWLMPIVTILLAGVTSPSFAEKVHVAVAANFAAPMEKIASAFERDTGHQAILSFGSTGALYAQITHGAPFLVFLAADQVTPQRLASDDRVVAGSAFTYAVGKLVLWSPNPELVDAEGKILFSGQFNRVAIANPDTAPYGKAAIEVLGKRDLLNHLQPKLVRGNNIAQAFQFVSSGNAEIGFIALSQVYQNGKITSGSAWMIPDGDYTPIRQDAVLLKEGANSTAATALMDYLRSDGARTIIASYGYGF